MDDAKPPTIVEHQQTGPDRPRYELVRPVAPIRHRSNQEANQAEAEIRRGKLLHHDVVELRRRFRLAYPNFVLGTHSPHDSGEGRWGQDEAARLATEGVTITALAVLNAAKGWSWHWVKD